MRQERIRRNGDAPIKLVEQFQHRTLHFTVAAAAAIHPRRADGINLIHKNNGRGVFAAFVGIRGHQVEDR